MKRHDPLGSKRRREVTEGAKQDDVTFIRSAMIDQRDTRLEAISFLYWMSLLLAVEVFWISLAAFCGVSLCFQARRFAAVFDGISILRV